MTRQELELLVEARAFITSVQTFLRATQLQLIELDAHLEEKEHNGANPLRPLD